LAILELLSQRRLGLSLTEVGRELGLPIHTVSRIASSLMERGYVTRREDDKRFVLTHKLFELARPQVREKSLVLCGLEALRWLRAVSGETTQLLAKLEHKVTVLEQCVTSQPIKVSGAIGLQVPMYSCAPGKAILAHLPAAELEQYLDTVRLKQFTPSTLTTREDLTKHLLAARKSGYAVDLAEGLEGIHCLAAAVLDEYHYPVAAITIMAPAFRLKKDRFAALGRACVEAAEKIRTQILL
jgi:IclR family acetate operon transcriptional repressor